MNANSHHPLIGKFDADPGKWRPMLYGVEIDVPAAILGRGAGSLNLTNQPYIITRFTHQIIGDTADPSTSGLYQDGQYAVDWKDEQSNYVNGPIMANCMWGSVASGFSYMQPYPLPYSGNKTLTFEIINRVVRTLAEQATHFKVQIVVHGIANWGDVKPQGR